MDEHVQKQIDELKDTGAGWVNRRDAVVWLGNAARDAIQALQEHVDDSDVDVKSAVGDALRLIALPDAPPLNAHKRIYSLESLATACAKPGQREVASKGAGYTVSVQLPEGRHQTVYLNVNKNKEGVELLRIFSYCGEVTEKALYWGLKNNTNLLNCALAILKEDGVRKFVLIENCRFEDATPDQVERAVKEIAVYGDWLEKKLGDKDEL